MKTLKIGELKAHFSEVLNLIRKGEKVVISYGKKEEKVFFMNLFQYFSQIFLIRKSLLQKNNR